jgi:hypothetical protein
MSGVRWCTCGTTPGDLRAGGWRLGAVIVASGKLGVACRQDAVVAARDLGLI